MTFDEYQQQAPQTLLRHDDPIMNRTILVLGMAGETGEIVEKWKKLLGYHNSRLNDADRHELAKELGDVLWYLTMFADDLGLSLDAIAQGNLAKLASRQNRDVLKGDGDNR